MQNETATSLFTPESFSHAIAKSIAEKLIKKQASKSNGAITSLFVLAVTTCLAALVYTMKRDPLYHLRTHTKSYGIYTSLCNELLVIKGLEVYQH